MGYADVKKTFKIELLNMAGLSTILGAFFICELSGLQNTFSEVLLH